VTGNLYLPKNLDKPAPAILYLCGHGAVKKDGVSYGNKVAYQHHGAWFAEHGYVCFIIDSLQLGEIEGIHHGTHRENMWWWNAVGYTPAGVEAWNCIRALDYLETRPEVDRKRLGATGRSGGGAYSWWVAALDDRIKAAAPVAGITDLRNHIIDGTVEGHCDCMFISNGHRWDYANVAALVAPRSLLIANSDSDSIFPLDGVLRIYEKTRNIYKLYNAADKLGLQISPGPHKDTQELQLAVFKFFDKHLRGEERAIDRAATKQFEPEELKVFNELPADQKNTTIHESFTRQLEPRAPPQVSGRWNQGRSAPSRIRIHRSRGTDVAVVSIGTGCARAGGRR
jgi:dienelactone hydrolase